MVEKQKPLSINCLSINFGVSNIWCEGQMQVDTVNVNEQKLCLLELQGILGYELLLHFLYNYAFIP